MRSGVTAGLRATTVGQAARRGAWGLTQPPPRGAGPVAAPAGVAGGGGRRGWLPPPEGTTAEGSVGGRGGSRRPAENIRSAKCSAALCTPSGTHLSSVFFNPHVLCRDHPAPWARGWTTTGRVRKRGSLGYAVLGTPHPLRFHPVYTLAHP